MNDAETNNVLRQAQSDLRKMNVIIEEMNAQLGKPMTVKHLLIYIYI